MNGPEFNQSKIADPATAEYIAKMFDHNRKHLAMLCQIDPETYSFGKDKLLDSIQLFAKMLEEITPLHKACIKAQLQKS